MLLQSKWNITLTTPSGAALVLLDFPDYLKSEPEIPRMVHNDVSHPLRSPAAIPLRSYNARYLIGVARVQLFATDDLAWEGLLAWHTSLPVGPSMPGQITTASGIVFSLANCLIQPGAVARTESNKLHTGFSLIFSSITLQHRLKTGSGAFIETGTGQRINA